MLARRTKAGGEGAIRGETKGFICGQQGSAAEADHVQAELEVTLSAAGASAEFEIMRLTVRRRRSVSSPLTSSYLHLLHLSRLVRLQLALLCSSQSALFTCNDGELTFSTGGRLHTHTSPVVIVPYEAVPVSSPPLQHRGPCASLRSVIVPVSPRVGAGFMSIKLGNRSHNGLVRVLAREAASSSCKGPQA
jgi:hypothetical protein